MITILTGMILTRVGCLLNGCCHGRPSAAWCSLYLPDGRGNWRHRLPTQCFEAALAAVLLASALLLWHRMPFPGALFLFAVGGYCAGRLVLESLRDLPPGKRFTVQHAISAAMLALSLTAFGLAL
jgi:phosphatidylglycerol---prolipoprotein diacylglyceryl transferase